MLVGQRARKRGPSPVSRNKTKLRDVMMAAVRDYNVGHLEPAKKNLQKVLASDPSNVDANHLLGLVALRLGKFDAATRFIAKAIRGNPNLAMAHNNMGEALRAQNRFEDAAASYHRAIALAPKTASIL